MIKLQPLRIPTGWEVSYNQFSEIEPTDLRTDDDRWLFYFGQDLLQMNYKNKDISLMLDLGWYPDGEPSGSYRLEVIKDQDWTNPLETFESRSKKEIVEKIEDILYEISNNRDMYLCKRLT